MLSVPISTGIHQPFPLQVYIHPPLFQIGTRARELLQGKSLLGFNTGLLPSNCPGSFWITPTAERGPPTKTQPEDNLGLGKIWLVIYQGLFT